MWREFLGPAEPVIQAGCVGVAKTLRRARQCRAPTTHQLKWGFATTDEWEWKSDCRNTGGTCGMGGALCVGSTPEMAVPLGAGGAAQGDDRQRCGDDAAEGGFCHAGEVFGENAGVEEVGGAVGGVDAEEPGVWRFVERDR